MNEQKNSISLKQERCENFSALNKDELLVRYQDQMSLIEELESTVNSDFDSEEKDKTSALQSTRRENVLVMKLACKEQEVQEYIGEIKHIKKVQDDAALLSLRQANLDPGVNLLFGKMREELQQTKDKLEQAQSELSAWKFTPDSQNGKKLIARCRALITENQQLGQQLSQGKTAQLEAELALQKKYSQELKDSQDELNEFVLQLDEEVEGMQSTIQALQQQLAVTRQDCERRRELICHYENQKRLKQQLQNKEGSTSNSSRASSSEPDDQSVNEAEDRVNSNEEESRSSVNSSPSFEEGEYVSGSENEEDNASVTSFNEEIDEYEILESVPSEPDEEQTPDKTSFSPSPNRIIMDKKLYKHRRSHRSEQTSRSPERVSKSGRSPQKLAKSYESSIHKHDLKRRMSSDKNLSNENDLNATELVSKTAANNRAAKRRRSSEHQLHTDSRIVVNARSDNSVMVNSR